MLRDRGVNARGHPSPGLGTQEGWRLLCANPERLLADLGFLNAGAAHSHQRAAWASELGMGP